jgi:putative transposase
MSRLFPNSVRSCTSFFDLVFDLMGDGLRFLCLTVRSHSVFSAEVLFLRKQLAVYEERETQPRRLTNSAPLSLVLWSQLFDWKSALVIVKPEPLIGWHRRGFKLFWK